MNDLSAQVGDSRLTAVFQPDELAAYEHRKTFQRVTPLDPERGLMLAVLEDAIFCFQSYAHRAKGSKENKLYQDAASWIFDRSDTWFFSFENICDVCGLDPDYLRTGLLKWREQRNSLNASHDRFSHADRTALRQWGMRGHKR